MDGAGSFSGLRFSGSGGGEPAGRQAIGADTAFLCIRTAGGLPFVAPGDAYAGGILEQDAGDDLGACCGIAGGQMTSISRRKLITGGIAATAGVAGLATAARLARRYGLIPPDGGGGYEIGRRAGRGRGEM